MDPEVFRFLVEFPSSQHFCDADLLIVRRVLLWLEHWPLRV